MEVAAGVVPTWVAAVAAGEALWMAARAAGAAPASAVATTTVPIGRTSEARAMLTALRLRCGTGAL